MVHWQEENAHEGGATMLLVFEGLVPKGAHFGDGVTVSSSAGRFLDGSSMEGDATVSLDCDDVIG